MTKTKENGRSNQRTRTRKDLLRAAARLLKQGRSPSLEDVAEEASVSRATAYRYFPSVEALLIETPLDLAVPEPSDLFGGKSLDDPVLRLQRVEEAVHTAIAENEAAMRMMLAQSLKQRVGDNNDDKLPVRQNRRTPLIEAALAPVRDQISPTQFKNLVRALALIIGTESAIVSWDVLQLGNDEAQKVRRWAIRALVEAVLDSHAKQPRRTATIKRNKSHARAK